jgi:hypothetical protein
LPPQTGSLTIPFQQDVGNFQYLYFENGRQCERAH